MIYVMDDVVVFTAAGLAVALGIVLLLMLVAFAAGAWAMRGHYRAEVEPQPPAIPPDTTLRMTLPGPHGGTWPVYTPGRYSPAARDRSPR